MNALYVELKKRLSFFPEVNSKSTLVDTLPSPSPARASKKTTTKTNASHKSMVDMSISLDTSYSLSESSSDRSFNTPAGRRRAHTAGRKTKEKSTKALLCLSMLIILLQVLQVFEIHRFKNFIFPNDPRTPTLAPKASKSLLFFSQFNIFETRGDENLSQKKKYKHSRSENNSIEENMTSLAATTKSYSSFFFPRTETDHRKRDINLISLKSELKSIKPVEKVHTFLKENKAISSVSSFLISKLKSLPKPLKKVGAVIQKAMNMNVPAPLAVGLIMLSQVLNPSFYFFKIHTGKLEQVIRLMC